MKSRFLSLVVAGVFTSCGTAAFAVSTSCTDAYPATSYYVNASTGSDTNSGLSASSAFQTIARARAVVSSVNKNMQSNIKVNIAAGLYPQSSTLTFTPSDSGTNGYCIRYVGDGGTVEVSGGQPITGWTQSSGKPYFQASLSSSFPSGAYFRQLYVNGRRATLAGQQNPISAISAHKDANGIVDGMIFNLSDVKSSYTNPTDVRLAHYEDFKADYLPVTGITYSGTQVSFTTEQPYTQIRANRGVFDPSGSGSEWFVQNALEELDTPGEWYLNQATRTVYYYPRAGETLTGSSPAPVYAPVVDTLVAFTGSTSKVTNISLEQLTFEYSNWTLPKTQFIGGTQAEALYAQAATVSVSDPNYYDEVPGQIMLNQTSGIQFLSNIFRHSGSGGVEVYNGADSTVITGNVIYDTTGAGVIVGRLASLYTGSDPNNLYALGTLVPYSEQNNTTKITDNIVTDTGSDFIQATGISLMNALNVTVSNNLVFHTAYMGIHSRALAAGTPSEAMVSPYVGSTLISSNSVQDPNWGYLKDNGSIYTTGYNPVTTIQNNTTFNNLANRAVYIDEESMYVTIQNNVVAETPYFFHCQNVTNITFSGNYSESTSYVQGSPNSNCFSPTNTPATLTPGQLWPSAAQAIITAAGLESSYAANISKLPVSAPIGLIATQLPSDTSGGWAALNLLTDGYQVNGEANNAANVAWVEYSLPTNPSNLTFTLNTDFNGTYMATGWKVQRYDTPSGTWVDLSKDYLPITNSLPQKFTPPATTSATRIRLYVQNTHTGGKIGVTEFTVTGTN